MINKIRGGGTYLPLLKNWGWKRFNYCFTSERGQGYLNLLLGVRL